ncbi:MAG: ABC transporter ATP-binding protein [Chloroflexota bacterium]|nr:ABC transporter ATP-binding protein [Chloroflexota bacterium]
MASDSGFVIETEALCKAYGDIRALDAISLQVPEGSIFGFLGPNGAGKTTTIRILMGFTRATSGRATVFGDDSWQKGVAVRSRVGYLVTADALYPDLSGDDQLAFAANISGREPVWRDRLLDALELDRKVLDRRLGTYSKGMRQKLALVASAQHAPDLLMFDEPTDGLDPLIQRNFAGLLRDFRAEGTTVFMSSHDLGEVERLCDQVAVVRAGRVIASGSMESLKRQYSQRVEVTFADAVPGGIDDIVGASLVERNGTMVTLHVDHDFNSLLRYLASHDIARMEIRPPELQEVFMSYYESEEQAAEPTGSTSR